MVCARFRENRDFVSVPYWQLHVTLSKDGRLCRFFHKEDFREKTQADAAFSRIVPGATGRITKRNAGAPTASRRFCTTSRRSRRTATCTTT